MHRIDTATALPDKFGEGKPGFTDGDPTTGRRATNLNADFFDALQEEISNAIEGANITLTKTSRNQLLSAIQTLINKIALTRGALLGEIRLAGVASMAVARENIGLNLVGNYAALPLTGGTLTGNLNVTAGNTATFNGPFVTATTGPATFNGMTTFKGLAYINGGASFGGPAGFNSTVNIAGALSVTNSAKFQGLSTQFFGNTSFAGPTYLNGATSQSGTFTTGGTVTLNGANTVNGAITINGVPVFTNRIAIGTTAPQSSLASVGALALGYPTTGIRGVQNQMIFFVNDSTKLTLNADGMFGAGNFRTAGLIESQDSDLIARYKVFTGNKASYMQEDGNIYGPVWGGYLNNYLASNWGGLIGQARRGGQQYSAGSGNSAGRAYEVPGGCFLTGINTNVSDGRGMGVYFRRLQLANKNGSWFEIGD